MQEFENPLFCMICSNPHNQPSMCPHCSKIFCHQCIKNHLANYYFCPSCNNYIIDLVKCDRLLSEVKANIEKKQSIKNNSQKNKCRKHDLPYQYYCLNCQSLICCDCGLLEKQHQGHQFLNSKKAKEKITKQLVQKTDHLNKKIREAQERLHTLQKQIQFVKQQEQRVVNDLRKQFLKTVCKIQNENKKVLKQANRQILKQEQSLKALMKNRYQNLAIIDKDSSKEQSISFIFSLIKDIHEHSEDQMYDPQHSNYKVPQLKYLNQYDFDQFRIEQSLSFANFQFDFDYKENQNDKIWPSPKFNYLGDTWRVKIYPNRISKLSRNSQEKYFLSVFVQAERNSSINTSFQFEYAIQLIHPTNSSLSVSKQSTNIFNQGDSWGFNRFIQASEIINFMAQGKLKFKFSVRSLIPFEKIRILQLNNFNRQTQAQLQNARKKSQSPNKKENKKLVQNNFKSSSEQHKLIIKTLKQWYEKNAVKLTAIQGKQLINICLNFNAQSQKQINKLKSELDQTIKAMHQISALLIQKEQPKLDFKSVLDAYDSMQQIQSFSGESSMREFQQF